MWRALIIEGHKHGSLKSHLKGASLNSGSGHGSWEKRLSRLIDFPTPDQVWRYISQQSYSA